MTINLNLKSKLDNFNMDVAFQSEARRIGILGASGAGKSMLLKYIAGISEPLEGSIVIDKVCVFDSQNKIDIKPQNRNVAYLFQSYALFPTMTIGENISIIAKGTKEQKQKTTDELLNKFHINNLKDRYPSELSGGQQQRAALARIMAYEPKLILLDEPFSALDESLKENLQMDLEEMIADYNGMVVLVSHNRDEIYRFSQELLIMNNGKSAEYGKTKEVFANPKTLEGAKMVGINNILMAKHVGNGIIEIPEWNIKIDMEYDIQNDVNYVGIRDIDLEPAWGEERLGDFVEIKITKVLERVREKKVFFTAGDDESKEFSFILSVKDEEECKSKSLPTNLKINKHKIVLF
ncbi:MAG: ATP-binding cassette domain-containing protein [Anaerovoracaceae bacterium]